MVKEINSKNIVFSILISLLVIQLSIPANSLEALPDRFERMRIEPVADLSLNYERIIVKSITGSGFGGYVPETMHYSFSKCL
jgi:hypothetical protein